MFTPLTTCIIKQTAILSVIYISAIGYVLVGSGITIKLADDSGEGSIHGLRTAINLMFAGGFVTTFFWVSTQL